MAMSATEISIVLRAVDNASATIRQVENSSNSLGNSFVKVTQNALGVAAGIAAAAVAGSAFSALGSVVVGFNSKLEQSTVAWKTFTGSAEAALAVLTQEQQLAASTPFEFPEVDRATRRFVNAGFAAQAALDFIKPLSNAVASVGLGAEGVDRVSLALAQMTQKGKVSAEEMLQLTEAQIPAWQILADATGKPIPELQKLVTAGKITASEYTAAFAKFYGEGGRFANAAKDQSLTFAGSLSTIRDQLNIIGSTAFQPIFKVLSDLARAFAKFVQSDEFTIWGAKIQAVVGFVVEGLGSLYGVFASSLGGILDVVSTVGQAIYGALQWINPFAAHSEPLVSQVENGVEAIKTAYGSLATVSGTFDTVRSAFENLTGVTEKFTSEFGDDLPTKVEKALAVMGPGAVSAFMAASEAVDAAKASIADIKAEWDSATAALEPLKDALDGAKDSLKDQQSTLSDLKSNLSDAKAAYDPLNEQLKAVQQNAKDAEQAIKDLTNAPLAGSAEFDKKISAANIGIKEQALGLSQVKQSTAYQSLGDQIEVATAHIKEMQRAQATFIPGLPTGASDSQKREHAEAVERNRVLADQARSAIAQQQTALDVLKDKQKGLLDPAQKELDKRRELLDTLNLEKDATIGVAQERIKAAAAGALGIKEQTEAQITAAIQTAKQAREAAIAKESVLSPQVKVQEDAIKNIEAAIRAQDKAVSDAEKTVDNANTTYSEAKGKVDDLGAAYRSGKAEIAGYDQQLKQLIQTGELQVQKADEAKNAADKLTKSGAGSPGAPKVDVLAGLDIEGSKAKLKAFQDQVATTRLSIETHLSVISAKWAFVWFNVVSTVDQVLKRFGGFAAVQPALDFLGRFGGALAALVVGMAGIGAVIGGFLAAFAPFAPALALILTPIGLLAVSIATLATAWSLNIGNIQEKASGLGAAFAPLQELPAIIEKAFGGDVVGALGDFVGVLLTVRNRVVEVLAGWGAAFVDWLLPQLPTLTTQLTTFASAVIGWILGQGDKFLTNLLKWGSAFVDWLAPRIPAIMAALIGMGLQILGWIRDEGKAIVNHLGEWAAKFIEWMIPLIPKLGPALEQIATAVIKFITEGAPIVLGALADWAGAFLAWVAPAAKDMLGPLAEMVAGLVVWIVEKGVPLIAGALGDWGHAFLDWIGPNIKPMLDEADKLLDQLAAWILEKAPKVGEKLVEWGAHFVNWIKETVLPAIGPKLDQIINGGEGFVGILPWIKAQADAFPKNLAFWVTKFILWIDDVVKGLPAKLAEIGVAIAVWVKGDGARDLAKAAEPLGQAILDGMVAGLTIGIPGFYEAIGNKIIEDAKGWAPKMAEGMRKALTGQGGAGGGAGTGTPGETGGVPQAARSSVAGWNPTVVEAYIRETAKKLNINPQTATRVAGSEGLNNPVGDQGLSFGPFQLYTGGGLGNQFQQQTGLNPADFQNNWKEQVDFALNWAKQNGWNPGGALTPSGATGGGFHGATAIGIGNWEGLNEVATQATKAVTDLQEPIDEYGQYMRRMDVDTEVGNQALRDLALTSGHTRGTFLEDAVAMNTGLETTVSTAGSFATQFGITLDEANGIIRDHGQVAHAIFGTDIPSSVDLTDLAVERFADAFKIHWDEARAILEAGGETAKLVMGTTIPESAQKTIDAVAGVGNKALWQTIDSNAAIAARSLKTYLEESGATSINVATASLDQLKKASGLSLPQMQRLAQEAGKDLKVWLQDTGVPAAQALAASLDLVSSSATGAKSPIDDVNAAAAGLGNTLVLTGNPAIDSFNAALAKIPEKASAAAQAYRDMVSAMDSNLMPSGAGGALRQAASEAADIGVHSVMSASGLISTLTKTYQQMSDAEREAANRFANANPTGLGGGGSSSGSSSGGNASPFPGHIGESGPGGKYNDPATGKPYTRAGGGPVKANWPYLIGEEGPEMFVSAVAGSIVPNSDLKGFLNKALGSATGQQQETAAEYIKQVGELLADLPRSVPVQIKTTVEASGLGAFLQQLGTLPRVLPVQIETQADLSAVRVAANSLRQIPARTTATVDVDAHAVDAAVSASLAQLRQLPDVVQVPVDVDAGRSFVVVERLRDVLTSIPVAVSTILSADGTAATGVARLLRTTLDAIPTGVRVVLAASADVVPVQRWIAQLARVPDRVDVEIRSHADLGAAQETQDLLAALPPTTTLHIRADASAATSSAAALASALSRFPDSVDVRVAVETGLSSNRVTQLSDSIRALPDSATIDLVVGAVEAGRRVDAFAEQLASIPRAVSVSMMAESTTAITRTRGFVDILQTIPEAVQVMLSAVGNLTPVRQWIAAVAQLPQRVTVDFVAATADSTRAVTLFDDQLTALPSTVGVRLIANGALATDATRAFATALDRIPDSVRVALAATGNLNVVERWAARIAQIERFVPVTIVTTADLEAAQAAINTLDDLPATATVAIQANAAQVPVAVSGVASQLGRLPQAIHVPVTVNPGNSAQVLQVFGKTLEGFGRTLVAIPRQVAVSIGAEARGVATTIAGVVSQIRELPTSVAVPVSIEVGASASVLEHLQDTFDAIPPSVSTLLKVDALASQKMIDQFAGSLDALPTTEQVMVHLNTIAAEKDLEGLQAQIAESVTVPGPARVDVAMIAPQQGSGTGTGTSGAGLSQSDARMIAAELAKAMQNAPAPVVAVADVRLGLRKWGERNGGTVGVA